MFYAVVFAVLTGWFQQEQQQRSVLVSVTIGLARKQLFFRRSQLGKN